MLLGHFIQLISIFLFRLWNERGASSVFFRKFNIGKVKDIQRRLFEEYGIAVWWKHLCCDHLCL